MVAVSRGKSPRDASLYRGARPCNGGYLRAEPGRGYAPSPERCMFMICLPDHVMLWSIGKAGDVFGVGLGDDEDVMLRVAALCCHCETGRKSNAIAVALVRAYE